MTRKYNNMIEQEEEANANALKNKKEERGPQITDQTYAGYTTRVRTSNIPSLYVLTRHL